MVKPGRWVLRATTRAASAEAARARSNGGSVTAPDALYLVALPVVGDDLVEVPTEERGTVDRIARALEAQGSGSALRHRTAILRALGDVLRAQYTDAREALRYLASLDRRLAVWGACACAREALRYVADDEPRPLRAIEVTERWLAGLATLDEVGKARDAAWDARADAYAAAAYAAAATTATYAAAAAAADAAAYADAAAAAANAAAAYAADANAANAWSTSEWTAAHNAELLRLVVTVADALPGLPPEVLRG